MCAFYYENFFGFEGSYAKVTEGVKNDLTINSKEFLYQMKSLAKNSEGIPSDYFEQYYKEIKNTKPKDIPIYGVVVTGKTEDLQGALYIKAAVRGVTVEKY
ncbi:anti sigma factor C-terminal domain-containing protein [Bacillus sp. TH12]|nr:anti sigma factor C-terminal domain-containing protein [Bacillus sp. TH12]HDR7564649.1 anti sigma factor C-terminal domain-containing protein [Bacillus mycoides]